jgi:hypothetical protein
MGVLLKNANGFGGAVLGIVLAGGGWLYAARESGAIAATGNRQAGTVVGRPSSMSLVPLSASSLRAPLNKYCIACHNEKLKTAGLALDQINIEHPSANAELWEKVVRKLRSGAMPPAGLPRPDQITVDTVVSSIETTIDRETAAAPNPGRPILHRLNRVEYTNAIRDLLGLEIDGKSLLPADNTGYGFDNIADVLSMSPGLLERYMLAAQKISRLAIGDQTIHPVVETYKVPFFRLQETRMSDDLPAGSRGGLAIRHNVPVDGEYVLTIRLQTNRNGMVRGIAQPNIVDVRVDGERVKTFNVGDKSKSADARAEAQAEEREAATLKVRLPLKAGLRVVGVAFQKQTLVPEGVGPSHLPTASGGFAYGSNTSVEYGKIEMGVDRVEIEGPFSGTAPRETSSRPRVFVCRPTSVSTELPCAKMVLTTLARRAYRRPSTQEDVQSLLSFFKAGWNDGGFDAGIERALAAILTDPEFLFRIDRDPTNVGRGTPYRVNDLAFASRLSFFLWSSIPDDELLDHAIRSKLREPLILTQQVQRMLSDPRSKALVRNFFGQWLDVRNIETATPDVLTFPEFDEDLREAFKRETELFLQSQFDEDHSVLDLLTANYTYLNERLAKHYGIPRVYGSHFRRVTFNDDRRAGILGQGSFLTVTSYPNRTSPVLRGKWLLNNVLGSPPPEPPPNVPSLPENEGKAHPKSVRERLEQHRKSPACASCHARMDPLGFAFENFDGIGKWRVTEANTPIDPSGAFADGARFDGPAAFRTALMKHREEFVMTVTAKLLTYALGRGMEYYDMPAIRQIVREGAPGDYRWSSLILSIVQSVPFQMRRAAS